VVGAYGIAMTTDCADNAATSADPLAVSLCEDSGPPVWVDPMLDELAASLVASRSTSAPVLRPSTDVQAPRVDGEDAAVADTVIIDAVCPPTTLEEAQAALAGKKSVFDHRTFDKVCERPPNSKTGNLWPSNC
jgi:hypothetical protein